MNRIAMRTIRVVLLGVTAAIGACGCGGPSPRMERLEPGAVILAFGDSLTQGTGAGETHSYPAILAALLERNVVNEGVAGEVTAEGLARLEATLEQHHPRLVILCHGGNDILRKIDLERTAENLEAMVALAQARGMDVILVGVPQWRLGLSIPAFYPDIAQRHGIPYEGRILKEVLSTTALKSDYVHPNAAGYQKIAEAIADLIRRSEMKAKN